MTLPVHNNAWNSQCHKERVIGPTRLLMELNTPSATNSATTNSITDVGTTVAQIWPLQDLFASHRCLKQTDYTITTNINLVYNESSRLTTLV